MNEQITANTIAKAIHGDEDAIKYCKDSQLSWDSHVIMLNGEVIGEFKRKPRPDPPPIAILDQPIGPVYKSSKYAQKYRSNYTPPKKKRKKK